MIVLGWVIVGNNGGVGTQEPVIAIAVGGGFDGELQRIGYL
jgi:hypothetical protein